MSGERSGRRGHGNERESEKFIPPDGGWGWMVVLGYALNNLVMVPLITGMGLIFKDLFKDLHFAERDASIIMSINMSFGMLMGITHGPLLRMFGYRKIALAGSIMFVSGLMMTAISHKFTHFIVSHGFVTSFGISLTMAAFSLALNTYFLEKRGRAVALAMTITGLGPIIMPQIITVLSNNYPSQHAIFILGAIGLHTVVASLLLQPVKWHSKRGVRDSKDHEETERQLAKVENLKPDSVITEKFERKRTISVSTLNGDPRNSDLQKLEVTEETKKTQVIYVRRDSVPSLRDGNPSVRHFQSVQNVGCAQPEESRTRHHSHKWWSTGKNLNATNIGSCPMLVDEPLFNPAIATHTLKEDEEVGKNSGGNDDEKEDDNEILTNEFSSLTHHVSSEPSAVVNNKEHHTVHSSKKKKHTSEDSCCPCLSKIVKFFDLSLLCDPIYVNIMLGMSIATFAEINFAILLPFILEDIKFETSQSATVMTTTAAVDLLMRGVAPFVGERVRQTSRVMYLVSLAMLIGSRSILVYARSFTAMIIMAIGIGFAKGFRSVFMTLILPNYIPIERLADAVGIQMVVNGLVLMVLGPLIGIIRELRGSYDLCIVLINSMTMLTIIMWTLEAFLIRMFKNRRKAEKQYQEVALAE
ncbi:uncharacterized protein LOC107039372 [Diachasma alloeum]|uniref:uncharacterized protein LOC107039372 n=1 Tax=Diachasma alloeum TaxID=454923 RepID=UPI0007383883|nr:uncharacterized protein LOC107039372 [Diachasma alloeum]